jgi:tetratricopeptide (TPR) repeat protein
MKTRSALAAAAWFSLLFSCMAMAADEYSSLLRAKKFAEAESIANARLAQDPNDGAALAAKSEAIVEEGAADRFDEAVSLGEQCVAAHPKLSGCYLARGNALGAKAEHASPVSAMGYARRIRDSFVKAVELDPHNTDARFALLDYYMQAPALVGGGKGKARELAAQTSGINPAAGALMQAQLAIADRDFAQAESTLLAVQPGNDEMVADRQRDLLAALGQRYQAEKRYADKERLLQVLHNRFP